MTTLYDLHFNPSLLVNGVVIRLKGGVPMSFTFIKVLVYLITLHQFINHYLMFFNKINRD